MPIKVEYIKDDRILVIVFIDPIQMPADAETPIQETLAFKKEVGAPVCRILDFSGIKLNFGDMVAGMAYDMGREGGTWDPEVSSIYVGTDELVKFGATSLRNQQQYQGANVKGIFTSREEALSHARSLLKK